MRPTLCARPSPTWRTRLRSWDSRRLIELDEALPDKEDRDTYLLGAAALAVAAAVGIAYQRRSPQWDSALVVDTRVLEGTLRVASLVFVGRLVYRWDADYNAAKSTVGGVHEKTDAGARPLIMSGPAFATCKSDAADKKLAGAALKSFMTKCERDATTTCETDSRTRSSLAPRRPAT